MISKSLDQIDHASLHALIGTIRESKTLEFKRQLPKDERDAKITFLAGVTALANTSGGDFIIGAAETGGALSAVDGVEVKDGDPDAFKRKLDSWILTLVDPALPPLDIREIPCPDGRWLFLVRTPRSWLGPHRVNVDRHFYVRTSAATVPLDVAELRTAFGLRESGVERIEAFRRERLAKILAGDTPVPLADGPCAVLHMAPLPAFANRDLIDIVGMVHRGTHMPVPFRLSGGSPSVNLHGICNAAGVGPGGADGYGQLFRSGAYESVSVAKEDNDGPYWAGTEFVERLIKGVRYALDMQVAYGLAFPTFAMLSLCRAERLRWRIEDYGGGPYDRPPPGQAVIPFPEMLIESPMVDVPRALQPLLDIVWNAYGEARCTLYDGLGTWRGF